jgi:hypothetical protein
MNATFNMMTPIQQYTLSIQAMNTPTPDHTVSTHGNEAPMGEFPQKLKGIHPGNALAAGRGK